MLAVRSRTFFKVTSDDSTERQAFQISAALVSGAAVRLSMRKTAFRSDELEESR